MSKKKQIQYLQKQIEIYKSLIEDLKKKNRDEFDSKDFFFIVAAGGKLCESILGFIVEQHGYQVDNIRGIIINEAKKNNNHNIGNQGSHLMDFCIKETDILPAECRSFVKLINEYRNKAMHMGNDVSYELVIAFSHAIEDFIFWFDNETKEKLNIKDIVGIGGIAIGSLAGLPIAGAAAAIAGAGFVLANKIKAGATGTTTDVVGTAAGTAASTASLAVGSAMYTTAAGIIDSLVSKTIGAPFSVFDSLEKKQKEEQKKKQKRKQKKNDDKKCCDKKLLSEMNSTDSHESYSVDAVKHLDSNTENILRRLRIITEKINRLESKVDLVSETADRLEDKTDIITETTGRLEDKVDKIAEQIKSLSSEISVYQRLTERQLERSETEEETERLITVYTDECAERILANTHDSLDKDAEKVLKEEKDKLMQLIGEASWNKLDEVSKKFLVSAKVMFKQLLKLNDIIDYSGVCVLITKALEVEMDKRFYTNFLAYLKEKYKDDYTKYPTSLLNKYKYPMEPHSFTMGNIAFVMCYINNRYDDLEHIKNNKARLLEYAQNCLLSKYSVEEIESILREYAKDIEEIRKRFRNPSAHTNELQRVDAEKCLNLVLDVEKLLKRMLDSFDT